MKPILTCIKCGQEHLGYCKAGGGNTEEKKEEKKDNADKSKSNNNPAPSIKEPSTLVSWEHSKLNENQQINLTIRITSHNPISKEIAMPMPNTSDPHQGQTENKQGRKNNPFNTRLTLK